MMSFSNLTVLSKMSDIISRFLINVQNISVFEFCLIISGMYILLQKQQFLMFLAF